MNTDTQTGNEQTRKKEPFGWHVVAFLDLLGQQDKLSKITALPNVGNPEEFAAFNLQLADCYKPVAGLRSFFKGSLKGAIQGSMDEKALQPFERELLKQLRSTPISYRHIADSVIVHLPLRNDLGKFPSRAIYSVLIAAASTFLACMAHSWAIRGGIELGLSMDIEEGETYGPALSRAHYLESRVAKYPRIVIGEELVRYLQLVAGQQPVTIEEKAHAHLAEESLKLFMTDDDGYTVLDWLGSVIRNTFQENRELVLTAYNFINQESNKHKNDRNSKLGFRYSLLRDYVESRLPHWGIKLVEANEAEKA